MTRVHVYTRGTCRYLEHDLAAVLYLAHVGPVLVQPHVADQQDLAVLDEAGEGAVHWDTRGQYSTHSKVQAVHWGTAGQ